MRKIIRMFEAEFKMFLSKDKSFSVYSLLSRIVYMYSSSCCSKRQKFEQVPTTNLDADDPVDDDDDDDSDDSDSEDDSMLLAELAKIRKERAAEQARKVQYLVFVYIL